MGDRVADFRRLFAFWIDIVEDPDISSKKDPNIHIKMMRDPQVYGCFTIRSLATSSLPRAIVPGGDDDLSRMYAKKIQTMIEGIPNLPMVLKNILLAVPMGLSVNEIVWYVNDELDVVPHNLYPVHKDRFVFDLDGNLNLRSPVDVFWGERVPDRTFLPHTFDQIPGSFLNPMEEARLFFGFGLNDILYPTWYAKQIIMRMQLRYLERFGNPTRIGRYPRRNAGGRQALQGLMNDLAHDQVVLFPGDEGYDLQINELKGTGFKAFSGALEYFDKAISKAYLGSTLLLDAGDTGSYSLGRVHERTTFGRIAEYDHEAVSGVINRFLIPWIFELNGWPKKFMPKFKFTMKESQDATEIIEAMRIAQSMGFEVSVEMIEEQTGFRRARAEETILRVNPEDGSITQTAGANDVLTSRGRDKMVNEGMDMMGRDLREIRGRLEQLEDGMLHAMIEQAAINHAA